MAALVGMLSLGAAASTSGPQQVTSISFTFTSTTNYQMITGGPLQVKFNSVQLDTVSPQAYSFGVNAKTNPGSWITNLHWDFGDGTFKDVPYCCQSQVSEVQYHSYLQPGTYTIVIVAVDNTGASGGALVTVSWPTPVPEYPTFALPLLVSLLAVLATVAYAKGRRAPSTLLR